MEPITTAALVSAVVALGTKAAEGAADKIGEDAWGLAKSGWGKIKALLGLKSAPGTPGVEAEVRTALEKDPSLRKQLQVLIPEAYLTGTAVVSGNVHIERGFVARDIHVEGDLKF